MSFLWQFTFYGWIAERAEKLLESFATLMECEDFMTHIRDFGEKTAALFVDERIWALSDWLRIGKKLMDVMRNGTSVPPKYAAKLADMCRNRARAKSATGVNFRRMPDFLHGIGEVLKIISEITERMRGIVPLVSSDDRREELSESGGHRGGRRRNDAPWQRVLVEARRVERDAERELIVLEVVGFHARHRVLLLAVPDSPEAHHVVAWRTFLVQSLQYFSGIGIRVRAHQLRQIYRVENSQWQDLRSCGGIIDFDTIFAVTHAGLCVDRKSFQHTPTGWALYRVYLHT